MLDELSKALGPWPVLQMLFGIMVLAAGAYAVVKGINNSKQVSTQSIDDMKTEWEAYKQLKNIEENTFRSVVLQEKTIEAINRLTENIWNRKQF